MDWTYLNIVFLIILILPCAVSQVYWKMSSVPAIFGQNTVLTCHLETIFTNPKDCTVRQWSGGPERRGLVYNGYSSDKNKYEEDVNFGSFEFSLIIKNLTESDINVNYTCSCGFDTSTKKLSLNENLFHYPPTGIKVMFSFEYDLLRVFLDIKKVYPVPKCSLYFGNSLILKIVPVTYKTNGFVYSITYNASYTFEEKDCNKQPELKCTFEHVTEHVIFKGNETYECLVYESIPLLLNNATRTHVPKKDSQATKFPTLKIALIAVALLLITIFIIVIIVWKYTQRCQCKRKRSIKKEAKLSNEDELFIEFQ
ncbi:uncharacterized protein LOC127712461 [Mytilus californianus]|uniref:uncharacterized protein LOC127712461 n=1 Tax=Mytilus californianus TaxID=6549 RepID=UPI00224620C7|nr:uncharacterized protein LOC127712461 [Mytilus californianus]XP_052074865.1 uncharacterized protein LOC127712461 [Mytilus californianus]XP_052074866.1 uncharacterized protein LOC127712461 [Mytilus californianus]